LPQPQQQRFATHAFILVVAIVAAFLRVGGWHAVSKVDGAPIVTDRLPFSSSLPYVRIPTDKDMGNLVCVQLPSYVSPDVSKVTISGPQAPASTESTDSPTVDYGIKSYEVVTGDTLLSLAQRFHISSNTILSTNN